ncbi:TlpA family protein disulfide reductase [Chitinophaga arvensicola]|uniref:TlpA family protein disulfide reductase n=1 Tax=Chitinophaga arvensicola TaxID=29529 RepID=UPI0015A6269F|nr:TlpA disulfide reductase family protein [Chitinophaga arvensicola]
MTVIFSAGNISTEHGSMLFKDARIAIEIDSALTYDSLELKVSSTLFGQAGLDDAFSDRYVLSSASNIYNFDFKLLNDISYFSVYGYKIDKSGSHKVLLAENYLIESGDSMRAVILSKGYKNENYFPLIFKGLGAEKNNCLKVINRIRYFGLGNNKINQYSKEFGFINNPLLAAMLNTVNDYRGSMSGRSYDKILLDCLAWEASIKSTVFNQRWIKGDKNTRDSLRSQDVKYLVDDFNGSDSSILYESLYYYQYLIYRSLNRLLVENQTTNIDSLYFTAVNDYDGIMQQKIAITLLRKSFSIFYNPDSILRYSDHIFVDPLYRREFIRLQAANSPTIAKDFVLPDSEDSLIALSSFKNKIIVLDFWFTGCKPCRSFYQEHLKLVEDKYKNDSNVKFITISVDRDSLVWKKSLTQGIYTSNQSINLFTNGKGERHEVVFDYNVYAYPKIIVIGRNGLAWNDRRNISLRSSAGLINLIESLK